MAKNFFGGNIPKVLQYCGVACGVSKPSSAYIIKPTRRKTLWHMLRENSVETSKLQHIPRAT